MTETNVHRDVFEQEDTVKGWDTDYYHPISEKYYDQAVPDMLRAMGAAPGDKVLDAGCGPGVHSIRAAQFGANVRAIDLSSRMLEHARERANKAGVAEKIDFSQDDLTALSLESDRYLFVFNWGVVIHIPEADKALDNLARVTAPGGKLALHILNSESFDYKIEKLIRKLLGRPFKNSQETEIGEGQWYDYSGERLWVQRFDTQKLSAAMAQRGLKLVQRRGAEFSEFQRRAPGLLRTPLLYLNNLAYALRLPASLFCTHILIFEKSGEPRS